MAIRWFLALAIALVPLHCGAEEKEQPRRGVLFHASFDNSADAEVAKGDGRIYSAESLARKEVEPGLVGDAVIWQADGGRKGGALRFARKTKRLVFFKGGKNVPYRDTSFAGTVSMWMRLDPKADLPKGFVDPLQITDKKWNDASFFVDFDQNAERDFRLGAFSDLGFWNPSARKFDDIPASERPMVTVKEPPFSREKWTHVAFTWQRFNEDEPGQATLYINGTAQGDVEGKQRFSWDPAKVVVMLGINYVGLLDELTIFDRALSKAEIRRLAD